MLAMITDPSILSKYSKEELINYIILYNLRPKFKQMLEALKKGDYNTRFLLVKAGFTVGSVSAFISHGLSYGYIKREWRFEGRRRKGILTAVMPSEQLLIKATPEIETSNISKPVIH